MTTIRFYVTDIGNVYPAEDDEGIDFYLGPGDPVVEKFKKEHKTSSHYFTGTPVPLFSELYGVREGKPVESAKVGDELRARSPTGKKEVVIGPIEKIIEFEVPEVLPSKSGVSPQHT